MAQSGRHGELRQVVWLKTSAAKAWAAITQGRHLKRWFTVPEKLDLKRGGCWDFIGFPGKVLRVDRGRTFSHTHTFSPGSVSRMTYELRPAGPHTELVLVHDRFGRDGQTCECWRSAWPFILSNLKTYLETGSPMREPAFRGKKQ
jgi:uncharacterized protein YndB with AHSA1/START domain